MRKSAAASFCTQFATLFCLCASGLACGDIIVLCSALAATRSRGWEYDWTYRRAKVGEGGARTTRVTNVGDITQINYQNDLSTAYLFLSAAEAKAQADGGAWHGGLNLTTLKLLEQRAWGTYQFLVRSSPNASWVPALDVNATVANTKHGLSKFPCA